MTDNWKALLWVFLCFLFCFFISCFFSLFFVFCVCFGGFKGQVRWPEGPPHLALNPPYLFLFFVPFLALFLIEKPSFPPRKGHFWFIFSVSLSFSLSLFWPPLCFCFSFSVSLVSSFLSSFLPLFFAFFWFLAFVSFFNLSFFFAFVSWQEQPQNKYSIAHFFFINLFSFFGFLCLFFLSNPFLLSLLFPDFKLCFLFNMIVFGFKKAKKKTHQFLVKRGGATKRFFYEPVSCKMSKVIVFFGPLFWQILVVFQKTLYK